MSQVGDTLTLPDDEPLPLRKGLSSQTVLALVIAWSADEPARVGEVTLLPPEGEPRVVGRGHERPTDPGPRAIFVRQRPSVTSLTGSINAPRISRVQLLVRATHADVLEVRNLGKCALSHNDAQLAAAEVRVGDVLQLGRDLLLLCVRRPMLLPGAVPYPVGAFGAPDSHGIVGESPASWLMRQQLAFIGRRPGHVLIQGSSGAGKELAARAIHALSTRGEKPLVSRNAATFPDSLIDAELFGNRRDYPNAGMPERPGLIGESHGTTLFLDEIGELPAPQQAHLLRVLDEGEYSRLGESKARRSDFRLIAATNRPQTRLKPDFLARFAFPIHLSDLNERREDIPLLARDFVLRMACSDPEFGERFTENAMPRISLEMSKQLLRHTYTLNAREIGNLLSQSAMHSAGGWLEHVPSVSSNAEDTPRRMDAKTALNFSSMHGELPPPNELGPHEIRTALDKNNGSLERTWRELGLKNRFVLMRLISKYGVEVTRRRARSGRRPRGTH